MTDREVMKMALKWMEATHHTAMTTYSDEAYEEHCNVERKLRQALAQPEQVSIEPPDYVEPITFDYHEGWEEGFKAGVGSAKNKKESTPSNVDPLLHGGDGNYIKQAQPEQEPVAWITPDGEGFRMRLEPPVNDVPLGWKALYTAPPPKQWVGLTEWERNYYNNRLSGSGVAEDIEFELRSRNEKN